MSRQKSLFHIHTAVLLFGLAGIFGKLLDLPSLVIVFGRVLFASISLLAIIIFLKVPLRLNAGRDYLSLVLLGLLLAVHWVTVLRIDSTVDRRNSSADLFHIPGFHRYP